MRVRTPPSPSELAIRVLVASVLVLSVFQACQRLIIAPLIPAFGGTTRWMASEFRILSAEVVKDGPNDTVRVRANLAAPLRYAGRTILPFGWNRLTPEGGYQVTLPLGGLLQNSALLLILGLAWPAGRREFALRILLCLPIGVLLLFLEVPSTVVAELWNALRNEYNPQGFCVWMVWSRFLMGGGGLLLAGLFAVIAIFAARKWDGSGSVSAGPPGPV